MREKKIGIYLMQRQRRITPLQCGIYHSFQARTLAEGEKASLQKVPPAEGVYFSQRGISSFTLGSGYAGLGFNPWEILRLCRRDSRSLTVPGMWVEGKSGGSWCAV